MTPGQRKVFNLVESRQVVRPTGPSFREVAKALGCYPNAVRRHVAQLRHDGLIAPDEGFGLVLTPDAEKTIRKLDELIISEVATVCTSKNLSAPRAGNNK